MARPPKPPGEKQHTPVRVIGRIADNDWSAIQAGAQNAGKTLTQWAREILLRAARRQAKSR